MSGQPRTDLKYPAAEKGSFDRAPARNSRILAAGAETSQRVCDGPPQGMGEKAREKGEVHYLDDEQVPEYVGGTGFR